MTTLRSTLYIGPTDEACLRADGFTTDDGATLAVAVFTADGSMDFLGQADAVLSLLRRMVSEAEAAVERDLPAPVVAVEAELAPSEPEEPAKVKDLMAALEKSLAAAKANRTGQGDPGPTYREVAP